MKQKLSRGMLLWLLAAVGTLALIVIAAGCGTQASAGNEASAGNKTKLTKDQYAEIEEGTPVDQLKSLAGEPQKKESKSMGGGHGMGDGSSMGSSMAVEYWYYQGDKGWVKIEVADGKVANKSGY